MTINDLPDDALLRTRDLFGNPPILPFSRTTWSRGLRAGRYPPGVALSTKVRVWRAEEIRSVLRNGAQPSAHRSEVA